MRYIELAINVLHTPPSDTQNLRAWAIQVMDKYSPVPVSDEVKRELKTRQIPMSETLSMHESLGTKVTRDK